MSPIQPRSKRVKHNLPNTVENPPTVHLPSVADAGAVDYGFTSCLTQRSNIAELQSEVAVGTGAVDDLKGLANQLGRGPKRPHPHADQNGT